MGSLLKELPGVAVAWVSTGSMYHLTMARTSQEQTCLRSPFSSGDALNGVGHFLRRRSPFQTNFASSLRLGRRWTSYSHRRLSILHGMSSLLMETLATSPQVESSQLLS